MNTRLSTDQIERYSRQIMVPDLGGKTQLRLRQARVLVIGAGGLGSPAAFYLAAAGIGTLGIIDPDKVELSNLQRQVIHATDAVGTAKTESAKAAIARINPHVAVELHEFRLTSENAAALIARYDIVVDGSDNFDTRYLVADACAAEKRPLVHAAVGRFDGTVTVLIPCRT